MESNKENIRQKVNTKIPLPLKPLPALPMHLLNKNVECTETRHPLQTLAQTNVLPSSSRCNHEKLATKPKCKVQLDTTYVNMPKIPEELDWDCNVFKDHNQSVISISDDDEDVKNDKNFDGKQRNCLGERLASTPSRRQEDKARRRLEINENLQERLQSPDFFKKSYMNCMNRDYTDFTHIYLLKMERKPLAMPNIPSDTRACVINWLMKVNGSFGNPVIIQSACWYLDSMLGTANVPLDRLQLVTAACYWIAQKLHGPTMMPAARLVKCANYAFSQKKLLAAEKAVLEKLNFPLQPVTPHEFITYLVWWCDSAHPGEIEVAANFICMSGLMVEMELCKEYPSVIACASIRVAVLLLRKEDMMKHVMHCPMYKAAEIKASSLSHTCSVLRRAVRTIADSGYEYKAPLEHYGVPPYYIAQEIINAARQC